MNNCFLFNKLRTTPFAAFAVLLACAAMMPIRASAVDLLPDLNLFGNKEQEGTYLYEAGVQHVKLVKQESRGDKKPQPNAHPVEFTPEQISAALSVLTFQHTGGLIVEKAEAVPLFSAREISTLAPHIARGLARADAGEELVFLIAGQHAGILGKEPGATTGRVFYVDGKLNLILGEVQKPMQDKGQKERNLAAGCADCPVDERTVYFSPASRYKEGNLSDPISTVTGIDFGRQGKKARGDWLLIDVEAIYASLERQKNRLPPALEKERRQAKLEAARASAERRQMREEMARMRKEMQAGGTSTAQSAEERIATLDKLKKKGLISPEEYDSRRKEILNDI